MIRKAAAVWRGTGRGGSSDPTSDSGVLSQMRCSFRTRRLGAEQAADSRRASIPPHLTHKHACLAHWATSSSAQAHNNVVDGGLAQQTCANRMGRPATLMDARGHCVRLELLSSLINRALAPFVHERLADPKTDSARPAVDEEKAVEAL